MSMHQKSPLSSINAFKPANTCFLLLTNKLVTFKHVIIPYLFHFQLTFFTMKASLLLLLLFHHHILITTSTLMAAAAAHPINHLQSSRERTSTSVRLHFSRYSSPNVAYGDQKRLVPTGANPLHNK